VAYEHYGTMLLQKYHYMRKKGSSGCATRAETIADAIDATYNLAIESFDSALIRDPSLAYAWLQSGILQDQAQDVRLPFGHEDRLHDEERQRVLLEDSDRRLSRAVELAPLDWYAQQRLAEVSVLRTCLTADLGERRALGAKAVRNYCKAASTVSGLKHWPMRDRLNKAKELTEQATCLIGHSVLCDTITPSDINCGCSR
jgi:hypothetical protein